MINDNEVREAVEFFVSWKEPEARPTDEVLKNRKVLVDLAKAYRKAGKEMPKKKKQWCTSMRYKNGNDLWGMEYAGRDECKCLGYNKSIDDCTLAYMKREAELLEKIRLLQAEVDVERCADWKGYAKHLEQKQAELEKKLEGLEDLIAQKLVKVKFSIFAGEVTTNLEQTKIEISNAIREHLMGVGK